MTKLLNYKMKAAWKTIICLSTSLCRVSAMRQALEVDERTKGMNEFVFKEAHFKLHFLHWSVETHAPFFTTMCPLNRIFIALNCLKEWHIKTELFFVLLYDEGSEILFLVGIECGIKHDQCQGNRKEDTSRDLLFICLTKVGIRWRQHFLSWSFQEGQNKVFQHLENM